MKLSMPPVFVSSGAAPRKVRHFKLRHPLSRSWQGEHARWSFAPAWGEGARSTDEGRTAGAH